MLSFVNGHLGYFHVLVIVNNAAMDIGAQILIYFLIRVFIFSRYMPRNEIALSYSKSMFISFLGTIQFSIVPAPIYFPTNCERGFLFLCTLSSIYYL